MANKKYKKGMTDASQAYFDFGRKQEQVLEHILHEVSDRNDKLDKNITNLYDYLLSSEKQKLYSIYTPVDIADLDMEEKLLLVGVLFRLTIDKSPTESQQKFIRSVQRYLEIKEPPFDVDVTAIEAVESMNAQKAIYQVVLEYLMLQDGDSFDETEIQHDLLDSFNLNNKNRQTIEEHVRLLYIATGEDGFVEKYGFDVSDDDKAELDQEDVIEPYVGISSDIADRNIRRYLHSAIPTEFMDSAFFETKDFFVWLDGVGFRFSSYRWKYYDKRSEKEGELTSLANISGFSFKRKGNNHSGTYTVDYDNNIAYFVDDSKVYGINILEDKLLSYSQISAANNNATLQVYDGILLIVTANKIQYYNVTTGKLYDFNDANGRAIQIKPTNITIGKNMIVFYLSSYSEYSKDEDVIMADGVFAYDYTTNKFFDMIDLSNQDCYIKDIFYNKGSYYLIYGIEYNSGFELKKISKDKKKYILESLVKYGYESKIKFSEECLVYYNIDSVLNEYSYKIFCFDFLTKKITELVSDCYLLENKGVFKATWQKRESDFIVLGQWLYYLKGLNAGKPVTHVYRVPIDKSSEVMDMGEHSKLTNG